jgi:maltose O-acetyltransferase
MKVDSRPVRQAKIIAILAYNIVYNVMPVIAIKNLLLRLTGIKTGSRSAIHSPVRFLGLGRLAIGSNSAVGAHCYLDNRVGIVIGDNVSISHGTKIYTLGHDIDDPYFSVVGAPVNIGDYACVFSNVIIMPGVTLGKGSVVYPGSVVTKDVENYAVVGGNPAKFIRYRSKDLRYEIRYDYLGAF